VPGCVPAALQAAGLLDRDPQWMAFFLPELVLWSIVRADWMRPSLLSRSPISDASNSESGCNVLC
jgi:hypothetical protein